MDCNINQAKCKGGLCRGCYKKQGRDGKKNFFIWFVFKFEKRSLLIMMMICVKIASEICLSKNQVRSIIVLFASRMGKTYQPGARGGCAESAFGKKFNIKN